jgi:hypothetical protein
MQLHSNKFYGIQERLTYINSAKNAFKITWDTNVWIYLAHALKMSKK